MTSFYLVLNQHRFHHGSDIKLIMHLVAQMRIRSVLHCQLPPLPVVGQYQGQYLRYTQYWVLYVVEVEFDGEVEEEVEEEVEGGVEGEIEEEVEREVYVHRVEVVRGIV